MKIPRTIKLRQKLQWLAVILCLFPLFAHIACLQASNLYSLKLGNETFEFRGIPSFGPQGEYWFNSGLIVIKKDGHEIYRQTNWAEPVCNGGYPALSTIKVNTTHEPFIKSERYQRELVVFCSSSGGRSNTLSVYDSSLGFTAHLEFGNAYVRFEKNENGDYIATVSKEVQGPYPPGGKMFYRILYKLEVLPDTTRFTTVMDDTMKKQAKDYIQKDIEGYQKHINETSTGYLAMDYALSALSTALQADDRESYWQVLEMLSKDSDT